MSTTCLKNIKNVGFWLMYIVVRNDWMCFRMCIFFGFIDLFIFKIGGVPVCSGDWVFFAPQQFFGSMGISQCLSLPGVFQHFLGAPFCICFRKKWQNLDELQCVILGNHHGMPKCRFISQIPILIFPDLPSLQRTYEHPWVEKTGMNPG